MAAAAAGGQDDHDMAIQSEGIDIWVSCPPSWRVCTCKACGESILPCTPRARRSERVHSRVEHTTCVAAALAGEHVTLRGVDDLPAHHRKEVLRTFQAAAQAVRAAEPDDSLPAAPAAPLGLTDGLEFFDSVEWESIRQPAPTLIAVPDQLHPAIAELWRQLADEALAAHTALDEQRYDRAWKAALSLGRLLFHSRQIRGGRRAEASIARLVTGRIVQLQRGEWAGAWADSALTMDAVAKGDTARTIEARSAEAQACLAAGAMSKALRQLDERAPLAKDCDALRELPKLFPPRQVAIQPHQGAPDQEDVTRFKNEFAKAVATAPRRAGAGPAGLRYEHIRPIAQSPAVTEKVAEMLLTLVDLRGGDVRAEFGSRRCVPFAKPGGKVRPILPGNPLCTLFSKAIAATFRGRVGRLAAPRQYGLGVESGAEVMHKAVLATLATRPGAGQLNIDAENAFNTMARAHIMKTSVVKLPAMAPWLRPFLEPVFTHTFCSTGGETHAIDAAEGLAQGDPLSTLLFVLGSIDFLERMERAAREHDPNARVYAYLDDVVVVGMPAALTAAWAEYCGASPDTGLRPVLSKSQLYLPPAAGPCDLPGGIKRVARPEVLRVQSLPSPSLPASSQPLALTDPTDGLWRILVQQRARRLEVLTQMVAAGMPRQQAFALLRSATASDVNWHARALGMPRAVATQLDDLIVRCVSSILGATLSDANVAERIFFAAKDSGLGCSSTTLAHHAAWVASWSAALPTVVAAACAADLDDLCALWPAFSATATSIREAHEAATGAYTPQLPVPRELGANQSVLAGVARRSAVKKWFANPETNDRAKAWARSCGGPGAGAWLNAPQASDHALSDPAFRIAALLRLGVPLLPADGGCPLRGASGPCKGTADANGWHSIACQCAARRVQSHDAVAKALAAVLQRLGAAGVNDNQPMVALPGGTSARSDLSWHDPDGSTHYADVTITSATSVQALRQNSANKDGVACGLGVNDKRRTYGALASVHAAVIERGGRMSGPLLQVIRRWLPTGAARSAAAQAAHQSISAALQRANADAIMATMRAAGAPFVETPML